MNNMYNIFYGIILLLFAMSCENKDSFTILLTTNKWQHFDQYDLESKSLITRTYTIFKENNNVETYLINSEDYPLMSGKKWKYEKSDSIFYLGSFQFKILKIQNDTIYMLNERKERNYLVKYKANSICKSPIYPTIQN